MGSQLGPALCISEQHQLVDRAHVSNTILTLTNETEHPLHRLERPYLNDYIEFPWYQVAPDSREPLRLIHLELLDAKA